MERKIERPFLKSAQCMDHGSPNLCFLIGCRMHATMQQNIVEHSRCKRELYHVLSDSVENDIVWMFGSHVKNKLGDSKTLIGIEATEPVTYYYLLQHT